MPNKVKTPWLFEVPDYAETVSYEMYPGQQGQDTQRDAARHMLAAGTLAKKYGPDVAEALGKLHEYKTSPLRALKTALGIGSMPPDYEQDIHNNALGIKLAQTAKDQEDLERLIQALAEKSVNTQQKDLPWIGKVGGTKSPGYAEGGIVDNPALIEKLLRWMKNPQRTQQLQGLGGSIEGALQKLAQNAKVYGQAGKDDVRFGFRPVTPAQQQAEQQAVSTAMDMGPGVIKPKGGDWLSGSVEDALKGLKRHIPTVEEIPSVNQITGFDITPQRSRDEVLNNWIDKQLTRYVKKEMATPEDPVRALAERGVLHYEPYGFDTPRLSTQLKRQTQKYFAPEDTVKAESDIARRWENASDSAIAGTPMAEYQNFGSSNLTREHPWIAKLDPESTMFRYDTGTSAGNDLGFSHLIDELRNATNPESGLPRNLLLKYESLPQVSVPQAVERVAKINEWRAAQKAQADLARANNAATVLHKEYPEQGYRWVELKAPKDEPLTFGKYADVKQDIPVEIQDRIQDRAFDEVGHLGMDAVQERAQILSDNWAKTNPPKTSKALEDALKYEGDTMGHCVGGYCPDVLEGRSRIFSLRDAKGQPHVTIETAPERGTPYDLWYGQRAHLGGKDPEQQEFLSWLNEKKPNTGGLEKWYEQWATETGRELPIVPVRIVQIKGKANRAPNPEYLPFVQDFVRSGKWSDVGDLSNTQLKRLSDMGDEPMIKAAREKYGEYVTPEEWEAIMSGKAGFAAGGIVTSGPLNYNADHINQVSKQLYNELLAQ